MSIQESLEEGPEEVKMRNRVEDLKYIYLIGMGIIIILQTLFVISPCDNDISLIDTINSFYFFSNKNRDSQLYKGTDLNIKRMSADDYMEGPAYIFENKLLFLYYGYVVSLNRIFPPNFKISFDVYPELIFKKHYPLDGKIISFRMDFLRMNRGICSLDFKLDLSNENKYITKFIIQDQKGIDSIVAINEGSIQGRRSSSNKMHFDLICEDKGIELRIDKRIVCRAMSKDISESGFLNLIKYPGSQFLLDNLRIRDLKGGRDLLYEDFNKYINLLDVRDLFANAKVSFTILFFMLFVSGYLIDFFLNSIYSPIEIIIPQSLFLMLLNQLCSTSLQASFLVIFGIVFAKVIYVCLS